MNDQQTQTGRGPRTFMLVQNRRLGLPERGKIKIGMKGEVRKNAGGKEWHAPQKLDHFIITTMERGRDGNFVRDDELMRVIAQGTGQDLDHITDIPVRLLWNDLELNFSSRYAAYSGRTLFCAGNGVVAERGGKQVNCPCERIEPDYQGEAACKINGILSVLIDGAPGVGGVWKFRTTAFNSVDSLTGSLTFIKSITGGQLAGIPLMLTVRPKQITRPDGKQTTIYMVGVEYRGTVDGLRDEGYSIAYKNAEAKLSVERAENEARRLLEAPPNGVLPGDDDPDDVVDEFYPNEAVKARGIEVDTRTPFELARDSLNACETLARLQEEWSRYGAKNYLFDLTPDEIEALKSLKNSLKTRFTPAPEQAGSGDTGVADSPLVGSPDPEPVSPESSAGGDAPEAAPPDSGGGDPDPPSAEAPPFPELSGALVDYEGDGNTTMAIVIRECRQAWPDLGPLFAERQAEWGQGFNDAEIRAFGTLKKDLTAALKAAGLPHKL